MLVAAAVEPVTLLMRSPHFNEIMNGFVPTSQQIYADHTYLPKVETEMQQF